MFALFLRGYWYLNGKWYYPFVASPSIPVPVRVTRITFFRNSTIGSQRITDLPRTPSLIYLSVLLAL